MQNGIQQRIMNLDLSIVADESKFAEFVHEGADAGSGRSDHLCQRFLADIQ
jgi:5-carboxymethyl-2-hydroxymuconate isomerase